MRTSRILGEGRSFYHVMSRVVDRRMVFKPKDKEVFRKILRNQEAFTGVRNLRDQSKGQTINRIPLAKIILPPHHHSMRASRLLGEGRLFYHVISRVVDRRMVFMAREKEVFRKILRNQEAFTGVRVVTY